MKKNVYTASLMCLLLGAATVAPMGCRKGYFDAVPKDLVDVKAIFKNKTETENWLAGIYGKLLDPYGTSASSARYFAAWCEELDLNTPSAQATNALSGVTAGVNIWTPNYQGIRLANIFMANVENPESNILDEPNGAALVQQYKGEARFLRAYFYWTLMKLYGPVVLVGDKIGEVDDNYQQPRNTWTECIDYVLSEMDAAKEMVPERHIVAATGADDLTQTGRITRLIIEAVQSQITLYDASPLFNGDAAMASFRNKDGKALMNTTYDAAKWEKAAAAAKAAIDHAITYGKKIYKTTPAHADPFIAAFNNHRDLHLTGWVDEGIWIRTVTAYQAWEVDAAPRAANGTTTNSNLTPPQEMVDRYRMLNGKSIHEAGSGYTETGFTATAKSGFYVAGTSNMYIGREPRFYNAITFNGATVPFVAKTGQTHVQFWPAGNSGNGGGSEVRYPRTGYLVRKNTNPARNLSNNAGNVVRPAMYIRLAELYLNYAEALNESSPGHADILTYLNAIRTRGGIPALAAGLSQEEMRKQIRLERCIELAYEGHRFYDVRRWKIANDPEGRQGGEFTGMNVLTGSGLSDPAYYVRTRTSTRTWDDRFYFFPLPQSELNRNTKMVQPPGY